MSFKYFLDDGIEYIPENGELIIDGKIETLQSLENKLLFYFVTHPNQLVSKETLYDVGWSGRIYGDNPLSKAISTLRSKLKDTPRTPKYIKTIPKRGFIFVSEVKEQKIVAPVPEQQPQQPQPEATADDTQTQPTVIVTTTKEIPRWLIPFFVLFFFMWLSISFLVEPFSEQPQPQVSKFQQLTRTTGQDRAPNISADNQKVVFTRQVNQHQYAQLVIKPLNGDVEKTITNEQYHHLSPVWNLKGDKILYHKYSENYCEIAVLTLNEQNNIISDELITQCGKFNSAIGLTWGANNSIYYTDIDIEFAAMKIYHLDIDSNRKRVFASPTKTEGRGFYQLFYDTRSGRLNALLNNDWFTTDIVTFDQQGQVINLYHVDIALFAVTSYQGNPVFKTNGNHIHFIKNNREHRLMQSPLWPISYPNISSNQQTAMAFVGGEFYNSDLLQVDFSSNQTNPVIQGDVLHKIPFLTPSDTLYYTSNQSGIYQIWKFENNVSEQLSQFQQTRYISDIAVSGDDRYLATTIGDDVLVYDLHQLPLKFDRPLHRYNQYVNPHFSPDSKTLWLSDKSQAAHKMEAYDIDALDQQPKIDINHAFLGIFDQQTGEHFVFKHDQRGVYLRNDDQLVYFTESPIINTSRSASIQNHLLTYYSDDKAKLIQWSFDTNEEITLSKIPYRHFSQYHPKNNQSNQRFIVSKKRFGNTSIILALY